MSERDFPAATRERVVVFDGGMGATLEQFDLTQADYGGLEGKCHEALVLNRPDVQKFYREHFLNFAIDIYSSVPVADFTGRPYTEKSYAASLKVKGTPTLVFYDLEGRETVRILGVVKDAAEFLLLGEFVASGAHKTRKFAEYKQDILRKKGS